MNEYFTKGKIAQFTSSKVSDDDSKRLAEENRINRISNSLHAYIEQATKEFQFGLSRKICKVLDAERSSFSR